MIEKAILGAMLKSPDALALISSELSEENFIEPRHKIIFQAIISTGVADLLSVARDLEINGLSNSTGGIAYLEQCSDLCVSTDKLIVRKWIDSARQDSLTHRVRLAAEQILSMSKQGYSSILVSESNRLMTEAIRARDVGLTTMSAELDKEAYRLETNEPIKGLWPRSSVIARLSGPYVSGDVVVVAGGAGIGKTFWVLRDATHQVRKNNVTVLFVPLEMSYEALARRVIAQELAINPDNIRDAKISNTEISNIRHMSVESSMENFYIAKGAKTPAEIETIANWILLKGSEKLMIVVDPAILAQPNRVTGNSTQDSRAFWNEIKEVTDRLSLRTDVVVTLIPHHTTKDAVRSFSKQERDPMLEDLDTAGHHNVSLGLIVKRDNDMVWMHCVKNRHGKGNWKVPMMWVEKNLSFEDIAAFCPICSAKKKSTQLYWDGKEWKCPLDH